MNIVEELERRAREWRDATALIEGSDRRRAAMTFPQLREAAAKASAMISGAGLRPGDAVLVFQPMSIDLYVALLAVFRLNLVAVFIDPSAGRKHVERCLSLYPPRAFIGSPRAHFLRLFTPAIERIPVKFATGIGFPGARRWSAWKRFRLEPIHPSETDTPALVTFTSGSTGNPKVAVRSHGFLLAQHHALEDELKLAPRDVVLATLPVFVLSHLGTGATSVIPDADMRRPGFVDPAPIVEQIEREGVRTVEASPSFFERIVDHCYANSVVLPGIRHVFTGGAPVFPRLLDRLARSCPSAEVVAVYGSTEAEPIAHVRRGDMTDSDVAAMLSGKGLLTGQPTPHIQLRILPDRFGTVVGPLTREKFDAECLAPHEVGEIVVSGAHVLEGYLHGGGDSETKIRVDGVVWHRTGDAGYMDDEARLWLLGRCTARIEDDHGVLYPFAVECAASQHPAVKRSACVAHAGRRLLIVETREDTPTPVAGLEESLAWASIDEFIFSQRIPVDKRHNAKIDYPALHKMLASK